VVAEALADVLGESYVVAVGVRDRDDDVDEMHGDLEIRYNIYFCCITPKAEMNPAAKRLAREFEPLLFDRPQSDDHLQGSH
jgi:hypothetical protein